MAYCRTSLLTLVVLVPSTLSWGCGAADGGNDRQPKAAAATLFTDITQESKLRFVHDPGVVGSYYAPEQLGSGGAFLDYDNDGDLDIYLVNGGQRGRDDPPSRNHLFRQEENGTFVDVTDASGLGDTGYGMGVAVGDIDNDGDVDVYVTNVGPDALYRNEGNGTFTDISRVAGVGNPGWGTSAVFFDFDLDGFLDVYVANYAAFDTAETCTDPAGQPDYCGPKQLLRGLPDVLYRNNGDGTFSDVSIAAGVAGSRLTGLGVVSADFTGDGYADLYVANDGQPNHLWVNQRNGTFQDRALVLGVAVNAEGRAEASMGIGVGDINNDADLDLFITHLWGETNTLYRRFDSSFQDDTFTAGLAGPSFPYTGFGTGFVDYDHDGDLDLLVVNGGVKRRPLMTTREQAGYWAPYAQPNLVFENDGQGRFRDVSDMAPAFSNNVATSRGLAFGDIDNDGDIDFLVTNAGAEARLIRNDASDTGHWLMIRTIDPVLQRDAIGAEVIVVVGGQLLHRLITPGYSYLSSSDPRAHFGLGVATTVDKIVVTWPGGPTEMFRGAEADQVITLRKGQGTLPNG